jgi:putative transcriptional regulator
MGDLIPNSVKIMDGLFWGGDFDHLKDLIHTGFADNTKVRFFLGYSGWDKDQLKEELDEDSWLVTDISPKIVMQSSEELWKDMVKQLGGKYSLWENFPENPALN